MGRTCGPGRPRKPRNERRGETIPVRCSRAEKAEIRRHAGDLGISMAAYLRERALGRRTQRHADRRLRNELRQLALSLRALSEGAPGERHAAHLPLDELIERVVEVLDGLTNGSARTSSGVHESDVHESERTNGSAYEAKSGAGTAVPAEDVVEALR